MIGHLRCSSIVIGENELVQNWTIIDDEYVQIGPSKKKHDAICKQLLLKFP